jgi:outer membrane lipoprotein-sorting protein
MKKSRFVILAILWAVVFVYAQSSPNEMLIAVQKKLQKTKDYTVDAVIKSDIPLIKILAVKATIYFKQKDKFKVSSKSIAILPKQGFNDIPNLLRNQDAFTAVKMQTEIIRNTPTQLVNMIANVDTSDVVLAKLWIDTANDVILKSQLTTKSSGTVNIDYFYKNQIINGLPDSLVFTIDVKKFKIPKGLAADINKTQSVKENAKAPKVGKIYISMKNYRLNTGLKDDFFGK